MTPSPRTMIDRLPRATRWALAGLLVGILGLVVQAAADPATFAVAMGSYHVPFPPGILFILAAGVLTVVTSRWRWHPVFTILIGLWIVGVGLRFTLANLASPNLGTVLGTAIMAAGLVAGVVAGIVAVVVPRASRPAAHDRSIETV